MKPFSTAGAVGAYSGAKPDQEELVGTEGVLEIARRQKAANITRGDRKRLVRGAARDLAKLGQRTIVLNHIQPRWLRDEVARRIEAGESIDEERIEQLRAIQAGKV